jgi:hypothetical protein
MELSYKNIRDLNVNEIFPKILYKYRSFKNENHRKVILNQEIYLSKPSEFLCPYDMNYVIDKEYVMKELNRRKYYKNYFNLDSLYNSTIDKLIIDNPITEDLLERHQNLLKENYDEIFGVFSTSETYRNKRLWSEFGDNKKGFCVGIDFLKAIPLDYGGFRSRISYVKPEDLPKSKVLDVEGMDEYVKSFLAWIFTLPQQYSDEQEYRFSKTIFNETERRKIIPKESIYEIIIGENMSKTDREELIELVDSNLPQTKIKRLKYMRGGLQEIIIK